MSLDPGSAFDMERPHEPYLNKDCTNISKACSALLVKDLFSIQFVLCINGRIFILLQYLMGL